MRGRVLLALALAVGCSAERRVAQLPGAPPESVPPPSAPVEEPTRCDEAERLASAGEHKPAVDLWRAMADATSRCPPSAAIAVEISTLVLGRADAFVSAGLERREAGDHAGARRSFERALEVYPRYYWAQRLLSLEPSRADETPVEEPGGAPAGAARVPESSEEVARRELERARRAQESGELAAAIFGARRAMAARPGEPTSGLVVEFVRRLGLQLFAAGRLVEARDLWAGALALDPDNEALEGFLGEVDSRLERLRKLQGDDG